MSRNYWYMLFCISIYRKAATRNKNEIFVIFTGKNCIITVIHIVNFTVASALYIFLYSFFVIGPLPAAVLYLILHENLLSYSAQCIFWWYKTHWTLPCIIRSLRKGYNNVTLPTVLFHLIHQIIGNLIFSHVILLLNFRFTWIFFVILGTVWL